MAALGWSGWPRAAAGDKTLVTPGQSSYMPGCDKWGLVSLGFVDGRLRSASRASPAPYAPCSADAGNMARFMSTRLAPTRPVRTASSSNKQFYRWDCVLSRALAKVRASRRSEEPRREGKGNLHGLHHFHFPTVLCSKSPPGSLPVLFFHVRTQRGPSHCPSGRLPIVLDVWRSLLSLRFLPYCPPVPCNAYNPVYCCYPTIYSLYSLILDLENKSSPSPTPLYLPGATTRPHTGTDFFFSAHQVSKHKTTRTDVLRPLATIYSNLSQHGPSADHAPSPHASR